MAPFAVKDSVAVAVSGGVDSLALTLLLEDWCRTQQITLTAFTLDHGLRAEAAAEAATVQRLLSDRKIEHRILKLEDPIGDSRIQETARFERYAALAKACKTAGIKYLATGHHLDDQFETVLMRLARGSGLKGLCGMAAERPLPEDGPRLIRPLLSVSKSALAQYCRAQKIDWAEDPSNQNPAYDRVQLRQHHAALTAIGLTADMLEKSRQKLALAEDFIQQSVAEAQDTCLHKTGAAQGAPVYEIDRPRFSALHPYLQTEILNTALAQTGQTAYHPRSGAVKLLLEMIQDTGFKAHTLNGCLIRKTAADRLEITPENTALTEKPLKNAGL